MNLLATCLSGAKRKWKASRLPLVSWLLHVSPGQSQTSLVMRCRVTGGQNSRRDDLMWMSRAQFQGCHSHSATPSSSSGRCLPSIRTALLTQQYRELIPLQSQQTRCSFCQRVAWPRASVSSCQPSHNAAARRDCLLPHPP